MDEKTAFLTGQVHALITAATALIAVLNDKENVALAIEGAQQAAEARLLPESVPETLLEGSRDVFARLRAATEINRAPG